MTETIILARAQFAFTVGFHILLPTFSIGLASYLAVLEGLWLTTGRQVYFDVYKYWLRIFAVGFAMGVVSGVVLSYQFGTNWARFSDTAGPIVGPLMAYEVLTAFFLEAGFLGVMLFGLKRVGPRLHFVATCVVAVGTLISAFWILSANSWLQTPAGYAMTPNGRFVPADWWRIVFTPSFPYRLVHMVLASYLSVAFVVGAVAAWHLPRGRQCEIARLMFSMAMWMALIVAPIQLIAGDMHGLNTRDYQPAKLAAMEGDFDTEPGTPLILFGMPDLDAARTDWAVPIPHLGALIITHSWNGAVRGLKSFPRQDWPPAPYIFWSFRVMVGIGLLMITLGGWSLIQRVRSRLYEDSWLLRAAVAMGPAGFIAVLAGWTTTEVGRQPFTVFGVLRTADSTSPIALPAVATSFAAFVVVYSIVFGTGFVYILHLMRRPPGVGTTETGVLQAGAMPADALGPGPHPALGG
ncbi:MAG: cytochrome bd ubiquinol oxidase subunit [Acetobacteraceae bacterium]|jgi:cytochrome d ubiquinol oxidase subunit I|nr:cytochrome ubiquinol oxidase subunit [Rhodopila sp.]MEA2767752.1 cytochrome bd ubiquinol oxidase subunit [Acetobacteraceae bacterium]